jgi:tRNA-dihydrouridine synthase 1
MVESSKQQDTSADTSVDRYKFYKSIGCPKYLVAPMVDQSELPYRMLTRRHGAQLCYTPMFHAKMFATDAKYRKLHFKPCPEDRPLVVQFCANDPDLLLQAAKYVENDCDAVDINLGCPQGIAKKGNYGSFLLEKKDLIVSMVSKLHAELKVPVTCKIRCLTSEEKTLDLAKAIQAAGASLLTVHGRLKEHNKHRVGTANYYIIKRIKETLQIPVIANGGISTYKDVEYALKFTGVDGVMSSESILEYAALFDPSKVHDMDDLCLEYFDLYQQYPGEADLKHLRAHMFKFLHVGLSEHTDLRDQLQKARDFESMKQVAISLKERRKDQTPESKIGWYYRHWKGMGLDAK